MFINLRFRYSINVNRMKPFVKASMVSGNSTKTFALFLLLLVTMSLLVTSREDLEIWDSRSYNSLYKYTSPITHTVSSTAGSVTTGSIITSTCWSSDSICLTSIIKGKDKVVLTYSKDDKYTSREVTTHGTDLPTMLQFPK